MVAPFVAVAFFSSVLILVSLDHAGGTLISTSSLAAAAAAAAARKNDFSSADRLHSCAPHSIENFWASSLPSELGKRRFPLRTSKSLPNLHCPNAEQIAVAAALDSAKASVKRHLDEFLSLDSQARSRGSNSLAAEGRAERKRVDLLKSSRKGGSADKNDDSAGDAEDDDDDDKVAQRRLLADGLDILIEPTATCAAAARSIIGSLDLKSIGACLNGGRGRDRPDGGAEEACNRAADAISYAVRTQKITWIECEKKTVLRKKGRTSRGDDRSSTSSYSAYYHHRVAGLSAQVDSKKTCRPSSRASYSSLDNGAKGAKGGAQGAPDYERQDDVVSEPRKNRQPRDNNAGADDSHHAAQLRQHQHNRKQQRHRFFKPDSYGSNRENLATSREHSIANAVGILDSQRRSMPEQSTQSRDHGARKNDACEKCAHGKSGARRHSIGIDGLNFGAALERGARDRGSAGDAPQKASAGAAEREGPSDDEGFAEDLGLSLRDYARTPGEPYRESFGYGSSASLYHRDIVNDLLMLAQLGGSNPDIGNDENVLTAEQQRRLDLIRDKNKECRLFAMIVVVLILTAAWFFVEKHT